LYAVRLTLKHGLNRTVLAVGDPASHSMRSGLTPTGVPEEHTLYETMGDHSASDHGEVA
jgi:hypothetical protein